MHHDTRTDSPKQRQQSPAGAGLPALQIWAPELQVLAVERLVFNSANPRADGKEQLDGLVASLEVSPEPFLVQPPTVEQQGDGTYLVQIGERRIRSAIQAGWRQVACLVVGPADPFTGLVRRLAENMHRRNLHPLDEAASLKSAWLYANAAALGAGEQARAILALGQPALAGLDALALLLDSLGFVPTHPLVTRQQVLAQLGLTVSKERLKQLLKVLTLDNAVVRQVRNLAISEAALRRLASLDAGQQQRLVGEIAASPALAKHVRSIAVNIRERGYSFDEALAQAVRRVARRAQVEQAPADELPDTRALGDLDALARDLGAQLAQAADPQLAAQADPTVDEDAAMERTLRFLEAANAVQSAGADLLALLGGQPLAALPEPWREYALSAAQLIAATLKALPVHSDRPVS